MLQTREKFHYHVQLQHTGTGVMEEAVPYSVYWSPEKVEPGEVAVACAAEATRKAGFNEMGQPRDKVLGLSAILQKPKKATVKSSK